MKLKSVAEKSRQSLKAGEVRKTVDLPKESLDVLVALGKGERMTVKPYMEKVLLLHVAKHLMEYAKSK